MDTRSRKYAMTKPKEEELTPFEKVKTWVCICCGFDATPAKKRDSLIWRVALRNMMYVLLYGWNMGYSDMKLRVTMRLSRGY